MIKVIATQLCTILACLLTFMAYEWANGSIGLNPFIALPIATIAMFLPHTLYEDEAYWGF